MTDHGRPWRWTCPHCFGGPMRLESADRHLRRKHADCWSCRLERLMIRAMIEGRGYVFEGDPFAPYLTSRARG
jgi:hypothetical protein